MKTSNPSSGEFQDQLVNGRPLYELVGEKVAAWGADCMGDSYSYVGAVVGATYPEQGKVLRKVMPKAFILVPGYGAQGGKGADLVHFFNEGRTGCHYQLFPWHHCRIPAGEIRTVWRAELCRCFPCGSTGYA